MTVCWQSGWRLCVVVSLALTVLSVIVFQHGDAHRSLYALSNLVGPSVQRMVEHHGDMTVCTTAMGTPDNPICFHAGRMPMAPVSVFVLVRTLGDHPLPVAMAKAVLFLVPLWGAMWLAWRRCGLSAVALTRRRHWWLLPAALLSLPFVATPFLADVVNLQVEEGYAYSVLALAVAMLLFTDPAMLRGRQRAVWTLIFALSLGALYLAKSAMVAVAVFLLAMGMWRLRNALAAGLLAVVFLLAPIGWGWHALDVSGRFTLGTSLDGINLHKGNTPEFLDRYPPPPGTSLDVFDDAMNRGQVFADEWRYNDFHQRLAVDFIRQHPGAVAEGVGRKFVVLFLSLRKVGSSESHGAHAVVETVGVLLMRLALWSATAWSLVLCMRGGAARQRGSTFLGMTAACLLPYLVGFGYTRHASVLMYPAVLLLCAALLPDDDRGATKSRGTGASRQRR